MVDSKLSNNIRAMRKIKRYTQKELAGVLGVGQTTIANYENGTRIPDAEKLNSLADIFQVSLDWLIGRKQSIDKQETIEDTGNYNKNYFNEYLQCLLDGNSSKAKQLILDLYEDGRDIGYIYFDIFSKALKQVGVLWEKGKVDIWKEHFICEVTMDIMREIKVKEKIKENKFKCAIGLTAGTETHNIGLKMIMDMLEIEGLNSIYLGSNVPVQSLLMAVRSEKPDVIVISVTMDCYIDAASNMIETLKETFGTNSVKIVVGGSAFERDFINWKGTGADYFCKSIFDILSIIEKDL